jgi:uncharacterized protein (DUF1697 family)
MTTKPSVDATYVALLRGINVGGKNKLPMKDLLGLFERAGCTEVRHYIQSGNVVFQAKDVLAKRIPDRIRADIEQRFGLRVPLVLRTATEMADIAKKHPLLKAGDDPASIHVMFLAETPGKNGGSSLDAARSPPDAFMLVGREIYLSCPNGARSKLTNAYFDRALGTTCTGRNWRTVLKLAEMCLEARPPAPT